MASAARGSRQRTGLASTAAFRSSRKRHVRRFHRADGDDVAFHAHPQIGQQLLGHGAASHPGGGLPGAGPLQDVADVPPVVLEGSHQVRVARTGKVVGPQRLGILARRRWQGAHGRPPVFPVAIPDQHGDGRAQGLSQPHARDQLRAIGLDLHAAPAPVPALATAKLRIHVPLHLQGEARRHALEKRHQTPPMGFARGVECEPMHGPSSVLRAPTRASPRHQRTGPAILAGPRSRGHLWVPYDTTDAAPHKGCRVVRAYFREVAPVESAPRPAVLSCARDAP